MEFAARQATVVDLDGLVPLFDGYRQFYLQPSEPDRVRQFVKMRLEQSESVIFVAVSEGSAIGFTQLYPSFSTGALSRIFILNDLFVDPSSRQVGVGTSLLKTAADYARKVGAIRLVLSTGVANMPAQRLYDKLGWKKNTEFHSYQFAL